MRYGFQNRQTSDLSNSDGSAGIIRLTGRDIRWLKHIERHGPQSSSYLHALSKDTHRSKDTALRQLQKLRNSGHLHLPKQQRATYRAGFNPFIYALTERGKDALHDRGMAEPTLQPHGHWVHGFMTACASASIDMTAQRHNVRFIPGHKILEIKQAPLAVPIGGRKLIPDQLFALDYGGSYRAFAMEVDRGTEPKRSKTPRKSYVSSIRLYRHLLERGLHRDHYGLKANLLILWVFSSRANEERFLDLVADHAGGTARAFLTQSVEGFQDDWRPPELWTHLFEDPWNRAGAPPVSIEKG
ncbi:replication-relaxation family protein [Aliiroseovarius sp.]|uniref:replication-relaxation family protein n=1 Tax=Aliiroseovarius sp. TaxID=1872442 RepID=UPI003BAC0CBE